MKPTSTFCNPYLPQYEYIPDGEPHVFGDRLYLYGSHDRFDGNKFCLNDYVCYSAPVTDLTDWRYEGVIYRKTQDPRMMSGKYELWAPDVVQGKDGRFYLYYCPDDRIRSIGVAVCDTPAGQYEFCGVIHDKDGRAIGERPGDTIQFDPGIFIDDDGTIYLYSGNGPRTGRDIGKQPKASVVMTLEDDMVTLKTEPKALLPTLGESEGTGYEGHEFFEASSIRKIGTRYYLVYSSVNLHELCYAVSDRPDEGFAYGGVIISNCDSFVEPHSLGITLGSNALSDKLRRAGEAPFTAAKKNCYGNNHGGIEQVDGRWYIFYHRQTNRTMFSRQGCAERIQILEDGSIPQVEMTSQGLGGAPMTGKGIFSACMVANLYGKADPVISVPILMWRNHPYLTQDGPDVGPEDAGEKPRQYIANMKNESTAIFRYFALEDTRRIGVKVRGRARGKLLVGTEEGTVCEIEVKNMNHWTVLEAPAALPDGIHELHFKYVGRGHIDMLAFAIGRGRSK